MYPIIRLRRNRKTQWLRDLLSETDLKASDLVLPMFVIEGNNLKQSITSMPDMYKMSIDQIVLLASRAYNKGIKAIALFPCIEKTLRSDDAKEAYNSNNLICRAIREIKRARIGIGIICDIALDPYTINGHDGIVFNGDVENDQTVIALTKQALVLARAGADILAPSDMMDGRVLAIRKILDSEGFNYVNILSYAVKYSSALYFPFREALSNNKKIYVDKATYQMDIRNSKEALLEIEHDILEGADMIMIKPGLMCLDIIREAANNFNIRIFAYQVSGEYSMLKFAAKAGALDWQAVLLESLISLKRAGASVILTYAALEVAEILAF